jgi:hypothetical protein
MSTRSASTSATDSRQAMRGSIEKYSTTAGDRWRVRYELPPDPGDAAATHQAWLHPTA